jgi:tRNA A58 N-methylase Trm61
MDRPDELDELRMLHRFVKEGSRVLEAGSGEAGFTTAFLATRASFLVAVDPLGPREPVGTASFLSLNGEWWNSVTHNRAPRYGESVERTVVDQFDAVDLIEQHRIDTLVLDVEGAEWAVLDRVMARPSGVRTIVAELHPYYADAQRCWSVMDGLLRAGFAVFYAERNNVNENWQIAWERIRS